MKLKNILTLAAVALATTTASAQQPLNGCWHPDDVKVWSPDNLTQFPDNPFNVAKVPLQKRFKEPTLMKANANQYYEGEICNSTILYPTCSMCPSQGEVDNFLGYQPTYWQYMDKLVYWAGAASEGIINLPPAASTDAAHAQGVKSLGNIFFPPSAYGGKQEWVRQMLTVENGKYIYAVKLYEMCKYFGFDGWFINEESGGGSTSEWEGFFKEFYAAAEADGNYDMELQWYNASRVPNTTLLKTNVNTSQFLEYGSPGDYRSYASQLGCTEAQTFSKLYGGVLCSSYGATGWVQALNAAMPTGGHVGSLDLFCPEVSIWEKPAKSAFKSTTNSHGSTAYPIGKTVFDNEEDMWVNFSGDPTATTASGWPGVSARVLERSAITQMPFLADMGVGNGKHRFVQGVKQASRDWYHSGMQSILPTWRWWIENKGNLSVTIDWDDAYNVGSSFKFSGTLSAGDHLVRLYKTQINVTNGGVLRVVYKGTGATVEARLSTTSSTTPDVTLNATTSTVNGWTVADFDLSSLNGKTLYMVGINLKADAQVTGFSWNLGQVALLPANYNPAAVAVSNLASTSVLGEAKGDIRLTWSYTWTNDFDHFDIYTVTPAGTRTLVGQTRDEGFYVPSFERNGNDASITAQVVPVMKDGVQKAATEITLNYPAPQPPTVTIKLDKSYVKVGETVTITGKGTGNPTAWEWVLPEGVELAEGSTKADNPVKVVGRTLGKKELTVKATNEIGTSEKVFEAFDVMDEDGLKEVNNVILNKTVVDYSGSTNSTEVPAKIIDGVRNPTATSAKWCNVSSDNWAIFDLEGAYRIYGFGIWDGNAGPESGVDQIDRYQIQLSADGENWVTVVDEENRENESIKLDNIAPYKARFVKLIPHVNGTLRIWEFEVYGKDDNNMTIEADPTDLTVLAGETRNITVKYNLNGDARADFFTCTATPANHNVVVGTITEDKAAQTFTVPVTGTNIIGSDRLTIVVNNGGGYKERTVNVTIDADRPNVLAGETAKVRLYKADYSYEAQYDEFTTGTLTDGNTTAEGLTEELVGDFYSTHKDDVWAIFTAPGDGWNLSKVKIYIPNQNQGTSDDGRTGAVNKEISIRIGNDVNSLTTVQTFTGLDKVSELEYILPAYQTVKYVAVVCNLNAYFYPTLAEVEAFEQFEEQVPVYGAFDVTGWNYDVIAESAMTDVNGYLDDAQCVLYAKGCKEQGAIAGDDRIVVTNSGKQFVLPPYDENNALVMKTSEVYTLTATEPANCEELYFLFISANGTSTARIVANYDDGTQSDAFLCSPQDWWSSYATGGEAVYGLGRIQGSSFDSRLQFRLYEYTMSTDKNKKIESLTVNRSSSSGYPTLLAIGKKAYNLTNAIDMPQEQHADRQVQAIYSLGGMRLSGLQRGINIIRYTDGTTRKVMVK